MSPDAILLLLTVFSWWSNPVDSSDIIRALELNTQASSYQDQGKYIDAERSYRRAIGLLDHERTVASRMVRMRVINNLADLNLELSRCTTAETLLTRALDENEETDRQTNAVAENNLAMALLCQNRHEQARRLLLRVLPVLRESPDRYRAHLATALNNLGDIADREHHIEQALSYLLEAAGILEQGGEAYRRGLPKILGNLGVLYLRAGEFPLSDQYFQRAIAMADVALGSDHLFLIDILTNYAHLLDRVERQGEAEHCRRRAGEIRRQNALNNGFGMTVDTRSYPQDR